MISPSLEDAIALARAAILFNCHILGFKMALVGQSLGMWISEVDLGGGGKLGYKYHERERPYHSVTWHLKYIIFPCDKIIGITMRLILKIYISLPKFDE